MPLLVRMEKWIDYTANNTAAIDFSLPALALPQMNTAKKGFQNNQVLRLMPREYKWSVTSLGKKSHQQGNHFRKKALSVVNTGMMWIKQLFAFSNA